MLLKSTTKEELICRHHERRVSAWLRSRFWFVSRRLNSRCLVGHRLRKGVAARLPTAARLQSMLIRISSAFLFDIHKPTEVNIRYPFRICYNFGRLYGWATVKKIMIIGLKIFGRFFTYMYFDDFSCIAAKSQAAADLGYRQDELSRCPADEPFHFNRISLTTTVISSTEECAS